MRWLRRLRGAPAWLRRPAAWPSQTVKLWWRLYSGPASVGQGPAGPTASGIAGAPGHLTSGPVAFPTVPVKTLKSALGQSERRVGDRLIGGGAALVAHVDLQPVGAGNQAGGRPSECPGGAEVLDDAPVSA